MFPFPQGVAPGIFLLRILPCCVAAIFSLQCAHFLLHHFALDVVIYFPAAVEKKKVLLLLHCFPCEEDE